MKYSSKERLETYNNALSFTSSVVSLYLKLAQLEKEGKIETDEYKGYASLLPKAIECEKRAYECVEFSYLQNEKHHEIIQQIGFSKEGFRKLTKENLVSIRYLNYAKSNEQVTLTGRSHADDHSIEVQDRVDSQFYFQLTRIVKDGIFSEEELHKAIDFKYALLMTSKYLERSMLEENCIYPATNVIVTPKEAKRATAILSPKIQTNSDSLFSITDDTMTDECLIKIAYTYACLVQTDSFYLGGCLSEFQNSVDLYEIFGMMQGKSRKKISHYIREFFCDQLKPIEKKK